MVHLSLLFFETFIFQMYKLDAILLSELKTIDLVSILFFLIFLSFSLNFYWKKKTKCDTITGHMTW